MKFLPKKAKKRQRRRSRETRPNCYAVVWPCVSRFCDLVFRRDAQYLVQQKAKVPGRAVQILGFNREGGRRMNTPNYERLCQKIRASVDRLVVAEISRPDLICILLEAESAICHLTQFSRYYEIMSDACKPTLVPEPKDVRSW